MSDSTGAVLWAAFFLLVSLTFLGISVCNSFNPEQALASAAFLYLAKN